MSRTIRTDTDTPRTPRRRRRTLRALTAGVLAAGSVAALAGPAQAYDGTTCGQALGAGNVYDVDMVRISTKQIDFGDVPHTGWGGGAPQGTAVICWANNGFVLIRGRLFYDNAQPGQSDAMVQFTYSQGATHVNTAAATLGGSPGAVTVTDVVAGQDRRPDRVRIQLRFTWPSSLVVHESDYFRGD